MDLPGVLRLVKELVREQAPTELLAALAEAVVQLDVERRGMKTMIDHLLEDVETLRSALRRLRGDLP